ncbi:MAG: DUF6122 family protein [Woeseia sp.]
MPRLRQPFFREKFFASWITLTMTPLIDIDHLPADPVYDPDRYSSGFHPKHKYPAMAAYGLLLVWPRLRRVAIGLLTRGGMDGLASVGLRYEHL